MFDYCWTRQHTVVPPLPPPSTAERVYIMFYWHEDWTFGEDTQTRCKGKKRTGSAQYKLCSGKRRSILQTWCLISGSQSRTSMDALRLEELWRQLPASGPSDIMRVFDRSLVERSCYRKLWSGWWGGEKKNLFFLYRIFEIQSLAGQPVQKQTIE